MQLALGSGPVDVAGRALVLATGGPHAGADLVEVAVADLGRTSVPVAMRAVRGDSSETGSCPSGSGALWVLTGPVDTDGLRRAHAVAGAVLVSSDAAPPVPAPWLVVEVAPWALARVGPMVAQGHHVAIGVEGGTDDDLAAVSVAVSLGARLVRTGDVRQARRVRDVLAAIAGVEP